MPKTNDNEIRTILLWMRQHRATYGLRGSQIDLDAYRLESAAVLSKMSRSQLPAAEFRHEQAVSAAVARLHPQIV